MIKCLFIKNNKEQISEVIASGHANYAKIGQDIVCSAVSVLFQSTLIGLTEIAKINPEYTIKDGYMQIRIKNNDNKLIVNALLDTLELSIKNLCEEYPKYLNVTTRRCEK